MSVAVASEAGSPEDAALWRAAQEGDAEAREALFVAHAPFARQLAAQRLRDRPGADLDRLELRQLAYAGLLEAIDGFDPARGVPFRAYAARRIRGSLADGIARSSEVRQQQSFRNRLRAERVRSLAAEDAAGLTSEEALAALSRIVTDLAIGFMLEAGVVADADAVDAAPSAYEGLAWREAIRHLSSALAQLPERPRFVVREHYVCGLAFSQIAEVMDLSRGRVSQLHREALADLRDRLTRRHIHGASP